MKHGTSYGYRLGCRCDDCRRVNAEYAREYHYWNRSRDRERIDNGEVRAYVRMLVRKGFSYSSIEKAAGIGGGSVGYQMRHAKTVERRVADAILSITPTDAAVVPCVEVSPHASLRLLSEVVPKVMSGRRFKAMTGLNPSNLVKQRTVTSRTHRRIVTAYRLLAREGLVPASVLEEVGA